MRISRYPIGLRIIEDVWFIKILGERFVFFSIII